MATTVSQGKINQDVAVMLERLSGRMDAAEARLKDLEDQRQRDQQRESDRRDTRDEKAPDAQRANLALALSAVMVVLYVATFLAAHWKP